VAPELRPARGVSIRAAHPGGAWSYACVVGLCLGGAAAHAHAQSAPARETLPDAWSTALAVDRSIRATREQTDAAKGARLPAVTCAWSPDLNPSWFLTISELLTMMTVACIVLPGAALVREKERGTIEHPSSRRSRRFR